MKIVYGRDINQAMVRIKELGLKLNEPIILTLDNQRDWSSFFEGKIFKMSDLHFIGPEHLLKWGIKIEDYQEYRFDWLTLVAYAIKKADGSVDPKIFLQDFGREGSYSEIIQFFNAFNEFKEKVSKKIMRKMK